jgi:hypothetical protein
MMRVSYPSRFTYYDTSAYYEYDTEVAAVMGKCSEYSTYNGGYENDWKNDYIGVHINGIKRVNQTTSYPSDNQQYVDISGFMESDVMNEFNFDRRAGNLSDYYAVNYSPRRCQTMAVVIVYRG